MCVCIPTWNTCDKLYIQYSKLYEFKNFDKDNIDLFLPWMMTDPVGDTVIVTLEEGNDMNLVHKSPLKEGGVRSQSYRGILLGAG